MNRGPFLRKSKNSLNELSRGIFRGGAVLALFMVFLLQANSACTGPGGFGFPREQPDQRKGPDVSPVSSRPQRRIPVPPWQLWRSGFLDSPEILAAEKHLSQGQLEAAVEAYRRAATAVHDPRIQDEAQLRLCGTLLKLGRSKEALEEISKYTRARGLKPEEVEPRFSLVAAYAYIHQQDVDQALAWLLVVQRKARGQGVFTYRAREEAVRLVRGLPVSSFDSYAQRWAVDSFIGPLFSAERLRRAQGGAPESGRDSKWFTAAYYSPEGLSTGDLTADIMQPEIEESQEAGRTWPAEGGPMVVGVLLPLSGRFAEHAQQVKEGIELAVEQYAASGNVRLMFVDTAGNPLVAGSEYERLVREEGVSLVLGPLLVRTTEEVAEKSRQLGVPFVSFTKRGGVPSLGRAVFRLGATQESQVSELLAYTAGEQNIKTFAILYPESPAGREFSAIFRRTVSRYGARVLGQAGYYPGDEGSVITAVAAVGANPPEAIFIPDSLESAFPILEQIATSDLADSILLGPAQWNDPIAVRGYGQLIEGAVYVAPFHPQSERDTVVQFLQRYSARFGHDPELLAAQAYDAASFALQVLDRSDWRRQGVIEQLTSADSFNGVTGRLSVSDDGEINRRMSVLRLHKGEVIEVMSGGVTTGFIPYEQNRKEKEAST